MTNGEKFDQTFGIGQANLAIATCSWWNEEYRTPDIQCDKEIQDLISHVGYSDEQCGYGEYGK